MTRRRGDAKEDAEFLALLAASPRLPPRLRVSASKTLPSKNISPIKPIPQSPQIPQIPRVRRIVTQLLPQARDMVIHDPCAGKRIRSPRALDQLFAAQDAPSGFHEDREQLELDGCELDR